MCNILNIQPYSWTTSILKHSRGWLHPVLSLGTQSPLYTWTWSHRSRPLVVPLLTTSEFIESPSCMTWNNNNSAPALKVIKRLMFSPEGNLQNSDMSPRMKNRFSKVLYWKFWALMRFDYILDICSFNNCKKAVGEKLYDCNTECKGVKQNS